MTADPRTRTRLRRGIALAAGCLLLTGVTASIAAADVQVPVPDLIPGQVTTWGGPTDIRIQNALSSRPPVWTR